MQPYDDCIDPLAEYLFRGQRHLVWNGPLASGKTTGALRCVERYEEIIEGGTFELAIASNLTSWREADTVNTLDGLSVWLDAHADIPTAVVLDEMHGLDFEEYPEVFTELSRADHAHLIGCNLAHSLPSAVWDSFDLVEMFSIGEIIVFDGIPGRDLFRADLNEPDYTFDTADEAPWGLDEKYDRIESNIIESYNRHADQLVDDSSRGIDPDWAWAESLRRRARMIPMTPECDAQCDSGWYVRVDDLHLCRECYQRYERGQSRSPAGYPFMSHREIRIRSLYQERERLSTG